MEQVSEERTAWAVNCEGHGKVFLTQEGYREQMMQSDSLWKCPKCGHFAWFDDGNYEDYLNNQ